MIASKHRELGRIIDDASFYTGIGLGGRAGWYKLHARLCYTKSPPRGLRWKMKLVLRSTSLGCQGPGG